MNWRHFITITFLNWNFSSFFISSLTINRHQLDTDGLITFQFVFFFNWNSFRNDEEWLGANLNENFTLFWIYWWIDNPLTVQRIFIEDIFELRNLIQSIKNYLTLFMTTLTIRIVEVLLFNEMFWFSTVFFWLSKFIRSIITKWTSFWLLFRWMFCSNFFVPMYSCYELIFYWTIWVLTYITKIWLF